MRMRRVPLSSARAQQAVLRRISSNMLPRHAASFSDGTTLRYRSWPPPMAKVGRVGTPEHSQPAH